MENSNQQNTSQRIREQNYQDTINQSERKNLYERYTHYIDSGKATIQHYQQKRFFPGQEKYIHKINSYIEEDSETNKPLIFRTEPGCGIKTILVNWEKNQHTSNYKKQKILPIMHFASNGSNNCNYFYSLYRIIIKLREALKLKQNVDLLEENIRKFFSYWMDLCSEQVSKQLVIYCAQQIYNKVVIVIQGVDKFIDNQTGKQANIAFWLPQFFPKNVKVIITASKGSESLAHLQKIKCQIIDIKFNTDISSFLLKTALQQQTILSKQTERKYHQCLENIIIKVGASSNTYTIIQFFRGSFLIKKSFQKNKENIGPIKEALQKKMNFEKLKKIDSLTELYNFVLDFWIQNSHLGSKLQSALIYLSLTQKGLSARELVNLTKLVETDFSYFLIIFNNLIIKYEGIYSIKSCSFIQFILEREKAQHKDKNYQELIIQYHQKISMTLQTTANSIRKLQEQTYHLFAAKSYFKLKQMISNIENFLLMFNPNNKYDLSRYWQKLEEKGFDPVIQYNKAVQGFSMHYHPSDQNIFRIIVQISRFLKQFCDFQTYETPNFRHPYIQGNAIQLHKIGLLKQLSDLDIFYDNSFNNNEDFDLNQQFKIEQQIKQLRQKYFPKDNNFDQQQKKLQNTQQFYNGINEIVKDFEQMNKKKIKKKSTSNVQILSDIQQLNVDVPMNRQKFRNHYLKNLQQFMQKNQIYTQSQNQKQTTYLDVDQANPIINQNTQNQIQYSFSKIRQNYRMRYVKPSLYYYKRWVWIQFPWVCISLNNNYSTTPQLCKKIEGDDFDTLQQEAKYTKQALLVAIQARERKKLMFTKKDDCMQTKSFNKTKTNMFTISKFNGSKFNQTSTSSKTKLHTKHTSTPDLSLNALTKQLEIRKKKLKIEDSEIMPQNQIFLSQINDNCQEDMKFISLRKGFQPPSIQGMEPNQVLPKLKWVIKQHTNYELNYIKSHIEQKKKKLNKIIYQNKKLGEIYQQLKLKQSMTKQNLNQHQNQKHGRKNKILQDLMKKKEQVITQFCKSLLQKERLKIILKLCSQNKTKNQQYLASLNYLLQNLKKMITCQKDNMKSITEQLQEIKVLKQKQNMMENEKQRNKQIVQRQAQNYLEQKNKLEKQIQNITAVISQDIRDQKDKLQNSLTGHLKNKEEKNILLMQQKKTKLLEEKLQKVQQQYECLRELFQFQGFDFENAPKFKSLMEENQRNKKLKIAYFQRKNKLEQVMKEYQRVKQQNQKQVQDQIKKLSLKKESKQLQSKSSKISQQKQTDNKYAIILDNIALKLGVKDKKEIIGCLQQKLDYLKQNHPQKYAQLMQNKAERA